MLVLKAQNLEKELGFGNLTEPVILDVTMLNVILITAGMALFVTLILAYIIPLTIAADPEDPLKWYYPCICGRKRKRVRTNDEDIENA